MNGQAALRTDPGPSELIRRFLDVRDHTEVLAEPLSEADCQIQSMPDASPTKWHLAHTTWFWETFLLKAYADGYVGHDPQFGFLFNSYYEAVGPRHARPNRGMITRPSLAEVKDYRRAVTDASAELLERLGEDPVIAALVSLGMAHEEQHQELILTDLAHAFRQNPTFPAAYPLARSGEDETRVAAAAGWTAVPQGLYEVGHQGSGFAFDNEGPRHKVWLNAFELANGLVTNGDVQDFIEAGGYQTPSLWLSAGIDWVRRESREAPEHWMKSDDGWTQVTLAGEIPVDPDTPAFHLSYYEADAIARFMGARLPTEHEWEVAASQADAVSVEAERVGGHCAGVAPVTTRVAGSGGLKGLFGQVWQWTSSAYAAYPGFRPAEGAIGEYNGKFMSSQYVLRGGSCATAPGHSRITYRNFFNPPDTWQFTGLRLARDN